MSALLFTCFLISLLSCSSDDEPASKVLPPGSNKPVDKGWSFETTPVWSDEFDYTGLPAESKWNYDIGGSGWGNNELQYYTDNIKNASVGNGVLTIKAIKEPVDNMNYSSARLVTRQKGDWLYGRFEIKAKLPTGKGTWPAIWMLPTDWAYGGWPKSGEIDIMEHVGYDQNRVHVTVHTEAYNHSIGYMNTGYFLEKFAARAADRWSGAGAPDLNYPHNVYEIRLSDTYLMEAEALVRGSGNAARALALLTAVRARVGLGATPATLDNIMLERRLELAGEGHRWFDLVRTGKAAAALAFKGFVAGKHEILPIPLLELSNTKLEQSAEYK